eukprot:scaffold66904_cov31-Prasinocladus_malaysianus.AAC.1
MGHKIPVDEEPVGIPDLQQAGRASTQAPGAVESTGDSSSDRGIVVAFGPSEFALGTSLIHELRCYGCDLPVE